MEVQQLAILNQCDVVLAGAEYLTCQYQRTMLSPQYSTIPQVGGPVIWWQFGYNELLRIWKGQ